MCLSCALPVCICANHQPLRLAPESGRIVRGYPKTARDEKVRDTHRRRSDPWTRALSS
jgi:hypothetical protein